MSSTGLEHTPSYAFALLSPPSTTWSAFDIDDVGVDDIVVDDVDDDASLNHLLSFFLDQSPNLNLSGSLHPSRLQQQRVHNPSRPQRKIPPLVKVL